MKTRILRITVLGMIVGFAMGIILSDVIGIVGVLGFGRAVGIKYLPVYLALLTAVAANLLAVFAPRKSKKVG